MSSSPLQGLRLFYDELKRRHVFRAGALYVVAAFAALEGAGILVGALHLWQGTMTLLVIVAAAGLPVALGLAWAYDIVPGGLREAPRWTGWPDRAEPVGGVRRGAWAPPADAGTRTSVAVVPFLNLSGDPENEYFADGITEDVIAQLSRIRALKVISRTSVMPFKARGESLRSIGVKLGARAVLDGSVRRAGDRVRIVAELVDVTTDEHLWAETYDRELTDIFAIQTDVALHIASALRAELSSDERTRIGREPTRSMASYQLYLKGRHWFIRFTPSALGRAIEYFQRAIAADRSFALAHATLAMAYAELGEGGELEAEVAQRLATAAAEEALRLDPGLGEAHCAMAHIRAIWEFDWGAAEAEFRRAIELCPSSADAYGVYGRMCAALGRFDEALALQKRAQELDPLAHRTDVATTLLRAGRWEEAEAEAARAVEFDPDHDRGHATLGWALFNQGRTAEGLAELERAVELAPASAQWLAQLGEARALAGQTEGAREILGTLERRAQTGFVASYNLAYVHTGLGDHERALDLLERAMAERTGALYGLKGSFLLAPLRGHPRFRALLARMNLS